MKWYILRPFIRIGIYQGNTVSIKFYDLYMKDAPTDAEKEEMALTQKQVIALQQSVGAKLDRLNMQFNSK
ncbi:hypothetical protein GKR50_13835 [Providencia rustigianii]|uniref:hypothetical protein n=1 Tax=Providencia rustigianii TaxID=158850 RepID=UPI000F6EBF83|nr:hypothetical protein [Providencia rustigianii]MTC61092.1 hypothetical protein [Providencia rustigianii]VEH55507.1 Uncharacterised protein [Providencia rustigianii]